MFSDGTCKTFDECVLTLHLLEADAPILHYSLSSLDSWFSNAHFAKLPIAQRIISSKYDSLSTCQSPVGCESRAHFFGLISLHVFPSQVSQLQSAFMAFTITHAFGQTLRYEGPEKGEEPLNCNFRHSVSFCIGNGLDFGLSWSLCSLCRCLTPLDLHQILLGTAMLSCHSQEEQCDGMGWEESESLARINIFYF